MNGEPTVHATVTFLPESEGGRRMPVRDDGYWPHIVLGDPTQREVILVGNQFAEHYLGVRLIGTGRALVPGIAHDVKFFLMYPGVDYGAVQPNATFTIREGTTIVGYGTVTARDGDVPEADEHGR